MPSIIEVNSLIAPPVRAWVTGETYTPQKQNADDNALLRGVVDLNSAIADLEDNFASGDEPNAKVAGKMWYDSTNGLEKVYLTGNGTPVVLLDSATAYNQSLPTGGTATFKLGGNLDVNTDTVTRSGSPGNLMTYTVPGATLSSDSDALQLMSFGRKTDTNLNDIDLQVRVGGAVALDHVSAISTSTWTWAMKTWLVRTGASTLKAFSAMRYSSDAVGFSGFSLADGAVNSGSVTKDLSANQQLAVYMNDSGGEATAQDLMIVKKL